MARILHGPELHTKYQPSKSLGRLIFETANKYPDRICQIDAFKDEKESYSSVLLRSTRLALSLQGLGLTSSDVIVNFTANSNDASIPILAAWLLGAKIANFDPVFSILHIKYLLTLVEPKVIFVQEPSLAKLETCLKDVTIKPKIIVFGDGGTKYQSFSVLLEPAPNEASFQPVDVDANDIATMFFTSGTTGLPKAICHSHRSLIEMSNVTITAGINTNVYLHFSSLYWISALGMLVVIFLEGGTRIFTNCMETDHLFQIIERYKVEMAFCSIKISYSFTDFQNPSKYDVSCMKQILLGGGPITTSQLEKIQNVFQSAILLFAFGMTEAGCVISFDPRTDRQLMRQKKGSVGRVVAGASLKIVDTETRHLLGPNHKGEILLKTPSLMIGYYKIDSTDAFDDDGFLKTGDIGYFDEDECIYVVDRLKEMFKYDAQHIVPAVLEGILLDHPAVAEVMVFGTPAGTRGDLPTACVVLKEGFQTKPEEIVEFFAEKVSDWERLRGGVIFCKELPRGPSGKLLRTQIRNTYMDYFKK